MSESEAAASAALMFAAAVMAVAWMADSAGLPIHPTIVLVLALASLALISLRRSRTVRDVSLARFAAFVVLIAGFTGYVCWLAWPSLLPITQGPDLVHHLSLIHFIQRRHALPHDPVLGAYLGEMVGYTPGGHLLAALAAEWLRVDAIRIVHALQAIAIGAKAGLVFCVLMRLTGPATRATMAGSLAGTLLLLLPYAYLLEPVTVYGFYSQVIAETFAVGMLWALVAWYQQPARLWLTLAGVFATGVVLSWPVYFPAPALAMLIVASLAWRMGARTLAQSVGEVVVAFGPAALIAVAFSMRHVSSAGILRSGGSVIVASVDVFGWAFLLLAGGGIAIAVSRWRTTAPVIAFALACAVQIALLAIAQAALGATNLYLANKTVFLLVNVLAVFGGLALVNAQDAGRIFRSARSPRAVVPLLVVGALLFFRGIPLRPIDSPISESVYRAGLWAKAQVPAGCVDYMAARWVTGYWLHLDVLGNPRASERMRTETFELRRAVSRWMLPGGPPFAIVEDLSAVPADARHSMQVLQQYEQAAVVKRTDAAGVCDHVTPIDLVSVGR